MYKAVKILVGLGFGLVGAYGYIHDLDLWGVWMIAGGMIVYDA